MRFPGEQDSYKKYYFKDIFLFSTGKNIKQNEASPLFENPCVRYGELYHMYDEVISEVVNKTNLDKSDLTFSQGNEILLPSAGEDPLDIGSASALIIKNIAIGRTINILSPLSDNVYSPIYVSYYINQRLRKKISTLAKGVSISNVYNSDLKTLEIILPALLEQNRIASFLLLLNERIQTQNKIIKGLIVFKAAIAKKIFSKKLRFKNENGGEFSEWEEKKLEEVCEKKSSNISANKIEENFGDYIIYGAAGILKNVNFYEEENDYISIVKDGAGVGRLFFCKGKSSVLGTMDLIKPKDYIIPYFLFCLLNTIDFTKYVTGSTIPHIYFKDYKNECFEIPSIQEQTKIANFFSSIDSKIEIEILLLKKFEEQKKFFLQNLFV